MTPKIDGRRRDWHKMPNEWPHDHLGTRLNAEFGAAGIGVWSAVVAAAKRHYVEGTFRYTTEQDGWSQLGLTPPSFTLEEFFRVTGRMKETRRRRQARVNYVTLTRWEELQQRRGRRKADAKQTDETPGQAGEMSRTETETETETETTNRDRDGRGRKIAREEAARDKANGADIGDTDKVGDWRYDHDPDKFDAIHDHREAHRRCGRCNDRGEVSEYSPGAGQVTYDCPEVIEEMPDPAVHEEATT